MKRIDPIKVGELTTYFTKILHLEAPLRKVQVFQAWDTVVGERIARMTVKRYFRDSDRVLFITISSSVVANQLFFQSRAIVKSINDYLGGEIVKKIVIK